MSDDKLSDCCLHVCSVISASYQQDITSAVIQSSALQGKSSLLSSGQKVVKLTSNGLLFGCSDQSFQVNFKRRCGKIGSTHHIYE